MTRKITESERAEARSELLKLLKPGATVYTVLRRVRSSGMSRTIDLLIPYTATDSLSLPATSPRLKIGADGYGKTGPRRFSRGTVAAFDAESVTFAYEATASGAPAESITFPRAESSFYVKRKRLAIRSIGWLAAKAMGSTFDADLQGIKVGGCGMDMGFHIVYGLGSTLWPKGTPRPHGTRNGEPDRDGGYALNHEWR